MPKFQDIPELYSAKWSCDVSWRHLQSFLDGWNKDFKIDIDPDYQRAHCWDEERRRKYIEYRLSGGRYAGDIQWNNACWEDFRTLAPMELVDGKQRLTSVLMFLNNELAIFDGHRFKDYTDHLPGFHSGFKFHVNNLKTRKEVLIWYLQINSGIVAHTKEEIEKVEKMLAEEEISGSSL